MQHSVPVEPLAIARTFVSDRFPDALAALLAGSSRASARTATSDLDIVVVLDDLPAPFRETLNYEGWIVELFVHTVDSLSAFFEREARQRRSPLLHMCATGTILGERDGVGRRIQDDARALWRAGPAPLSAAELEGLRYRLTDILDDVAGCRDQDELIFVASRLLTQACELVLLDHRSWIGGGKWLLRRLRDADPHTCEALLAGYREAVCSGQTVRLHQAAAAVLARVGGRLMEGYRQEASTGKPDG